MLNLSDPYILVTLLTATVILIMACCLLGFSVPNDPELKNYRTARRLLACAYIVLACSGASELLAGGRSVGSPLVLSLTLIIACYQALLFTFALITLIDLRLMTTKRVLAQLIPISAVSGLVMLSLALAPDIIFYAVFYIACAYYCALLVYYIHLFRKDYKRYREQLDNYFSQDDEKRMRWINSAFYMALSIGILAVLSIFMSSFLYLLFTIGYTIFYVYFAVKYVNYVTIFHYFVPAIGNGAYENQPQANGTKDDISLLIDIWIRQKGYVRSDITLGSLALELKTNRTYLSGYINSHRGCNFKTWISRLRIEEAQRLLIENPALSVASIGEMVGIDDKSSFFRQFMNVAGKTPGEYRQENLIISN